MDWIFLPLGHLICHRIKINGLCFEFKNMLSVLVSNSNGNGKGMAMFLAM